jgi:hypothetical protein
MNPFTADDVRLLKARGVTLEEAQRQLVLLRDTDHFVRLVGPCVPGDGIRRVAPDDVRRLQQVAVEAVAAGRAVKFVPASGAASRMFRELQHFQTAPVQPGIARIEADAAAGGKEARALLDFLAGVTRLALSGTLRRHLPADGESLEMLAARGSYAPILDALLSPEGMDAGRRPKGLLDFHKYEDATRTAFEEQLREAATLVRDRDGNARAHFTVSTDHEPAFRAELDRVREAIEADGAHLDVTFSTQKPSTDTIATELDERPFRLDGRLLFRPAGHGALIEDLSDLSADLVLIKNIDNVTPERAKGLRFEWSRVLLGLLVDVQARAFEHVRALEANGDEAPVEEALAFLREAFDDELPPGVTEAGARRLGALQMLDRPMRVCGMVPNTGEPGGGPFFIEQADGSPGQQIIEMAQIDRTDSTQADMVKQSTHFNPVFLACGLQNHRGEPFDLPRFVDPEAVIVTRKSADGRELNALERPGLWNGAMAHWSTIFVEMPLEIFTPVKSVLDLLRPEHQPAGTEA